MTEESTVNLALIGTGAWSGSVGDAMMKSTKVNLVTCYDPIAEKREALSARFGCEDVTTTIFQYETGVLGYLGSNYASPKAVWFYIYGTEANLLCTITPPEVPFEEYLPWWQQVDQDTDVQIFEKGKTGSSKVDLKLGNPILEEIDEFADCILTGAQPETDGEGALSALSFIRAAIESAKTGRQAKLGT